MVYRQHLFPLSLAVNNRAPKRAFTLRQQFKKQITLCECLRVRHCTELHRTMNTIGMVSGLWDM